MGLLWRITAQKTVDWQGWFFAAYSKGEDSWNKSYAECMVWSPRYYSFWDLKAPSDTQWRLILPTAATYTLKS